MPPMPQRSPPCSTPAGSQPLRGWWPIPRGAAFAASTHVWCAVCRCRQPAPRCGQSWRAAVNAVSPLTISSPMRSNSMAPTAARWPRILSEHLVPVPEPFAVALRPAGEAPPRDVVGSAARALLDGTPVAPIPWPAWLAPHQVPAAERLTAIIARYGGALLADAVGLGKSYVALAVALARQEPFTLVVPAVLVSQWRGLLDRFGVQETPIVTHESLSVSARSVGAQHAAPLHTHAGLFVIDEAHRFRNPDTNRYRALARLVVGSRVLLVTATPIHNCVADLLHLLRLFLRDHALAALGLPSLDRKSTRLNSSHSSISYAVFCLKKKKKTNSTHLLNKKKKKNIQ